MKRLFLILGLMAGLPAVNFGLAASFNSASGLTFPAVATGRAATPFPSTITVGSGALPAGNITSVKVTLNGLTHSRPPDIELALVSPWGAKFIFMADVSSAGLPVSGLNLTIDDAAANLMPDTSAALSSGSYKPTAQTGLGISTDLLSGSGAVSPGDAAAPLGTKTFTSAFAGANNPVGDWKLYAVDDVSTAETGTLTSWTLEIDVSPTTVGTTTTLGSSVNPSTTGESVTFTATVVSASDATPVTTGTLTFKDGASTLVSGVALNGAGQATFATAGLSEGDHAISAEYAPGTGFLASSGSLNQRVNNATVVSGNTFSNPGALTLASSGSGVANVYPSHVFVSGLSGTISKVTLAVNGITIDRPDDLELLLVAPGGQTFLLMGDAGGTAGGIAAVNLVFDDAAASSLPDGSAFSSGTFRPTSHGTSTLPAPAPAGPHSHAAPAGSSTFATVFSGANPNGTWSLYAFDDVTGSGGSISGGWGLTFTTTADAATTTTVESTPNPSLTGESVTFTATVVNAGNGTPVTSGSVTFREGTTTLAGPLALDVSGQASFSTGALTEGDHTITADYGGSAGSFNLSSGSTSHRVNNVTVVNGESACNPGAILISATPPSLGSVYPSHVTVTGRSGPITGVRLSLLGISVDRPDDLEVLLVGPSGTALLVVGDTGGTLTPANDVDLVLDDSAANLIPDEGPLVSGTFRPTSVNVSAPSFPSPAPASGSIQHAAPGGAATFASVFNGGSANGIWSLYILDDAGGGGATLGGGWCVTVETDDPPVAGGDEVTRDSDRSVKVLIARLLENDVDPEGASPSFVGVAATSANGAAVHRVGLWIEYKAVPGVNGDDTFTYTVSDGTSTSEGVVTVKVSRPEGQTLNLTATAQGADVLLRVSGIPGRAYQIQMTTSLVSPVGWSDLGPALTADGVGRVAHTDVAPPSPRFYRAIEP